LGRNGVISKADILTKIVKNNIVHTGLIEVISQLLYHNNATVELKNVPEVKGIKCIVSKWRCNRLAAYFSVVRWGVVGVLIL
jgi:hypothetical protein